MKYSMSVLRRTISIHEQLLLETNNMETHRIGWFRTVRKDLEGGVGEKVDYPFSKGSGYAVDTHEPQSCWTSTSRG